MPSSVMNVNLMSMNNKRQVVFLSSMTEANNVLLNKTIDKLNKSNGSF